MEFKGHLDPNLHKSFQVEKLSRVIKKCDQIEILREIAMELLKLNQKKNTIISWANSNAVKAESSIRISKSELYDDNLI